MKKAFQGFGNTVYIIGKFIVRIQSKGWDAKDQQLLIIGGTERNLLGNDILPNLRIEVLQKQSPPQNQTHRRSGPKYPTGYRSISKV